MKPGTGKTFRPIGPTTYLSPIPAVMLGCADPENGLLGPKSAINLAIWDKFVEHGIQIPFPQREVRVLGDVSMIPQESRQA